MSNEKRIDQIAAMVALARQYTEPLDRQPPNPSMLERFLECTTNALDEFLDFIEKPNIRERFAAFIGTFGVLGGGAIIGTGIAGIVAAFVSVKGAIALIVMGAIFIGAVLLLAYVVKGK